MQDHDESDLVMERGDVLGLFASQICENDDCSILLQVDATKKEELLTGDHSHSCQNLEAWLYGVEKIRKPTINSPS